MLSSLTKIVLLLVGFTLVSVCCNVENTVFLMLESCVLLTALFMLRNNDLIHVLLLMLA